MKLIIARDQLLKPLQWATGVVERRKNMPILANILVKIDANQALLIATDLEVEIIAQLTIEGKFVAGETTIPGRKLLEICRALPEHASIEIQTEDSRVIIRSGHSRFTLSTLPAADFPRVAEDVGQSEFSLTQQQLRGLIERTQLAIAQNDARHYLNGMLIEVQNGRVTAVGADGHRMSVSSIVVPAINVPAKFEIIIPRKSITELSRLLDSDEDMVDIKLSSNHIQVMTNKFTFTSKLIDATFPDYHLVLPKQGDKVIVVPRETFKQVLMRASILSNEKVRGVCLQLRSGVLLIMANNPEQEEAEDQLSIEYEGADLDIGFNVNYLIDILNTTHNELIQMTFSTANDGVLVEEIGMPNNVYVVMPMRL